MNALERLAGAIAGCEACSEEVREALELHLIDTVGAWIASTRSAEGLALLRFRAATRASGHADAALDLATRCALARLSEIDDIDLAAMITPGAVVIPAALSLAATTPAVAADDVAAAIVAGIEVMIRLGRALDGPAILYRGIWPTYLAAPFGVAAAAARLLRLDPQASADALALALTLAAPGVGHHNAATTARWFALGRAASNGLSAARAAQQGFTADRGLLEGQFFPAIYGVTPRTAALAESLDRLDAITEVSFKPWCAARQTMAATQALNEIIEAGIAPAAMEEIRVAVLPPHLRMIDHGIVPGDRASHLTSVQYRMTVAALAPELAFEIGQAPAALPPALRAFMAKIKVEADETLLADYPRVWPACVRVTAGAAQHERMVTHVPGDPARPFDRARVREKFLRFVQPVLGGKAAGERMLARCEEALATGQFAPLVGDIEQACGDALARTAAR
jgi:2-methylcitrate dehydratase PrpD